MTGGLKTDDVVGERYRIVKRLGMGGMGAVYLANVEGVAGFEKLVALKVAHGHVSGDKSVMEMFLAEARLSAQLQHANLGQVYDLGQSGDLYFIAMEYIRGVDLRTLINAVSEQEGRLPVPLAVAIVSRLLEGLAHAHALRDKTGMPLKLVHRDVTPANTLISYSGEVKLIDFGIAKAANQASRTQTGMVRGKVTYMSPEQLRAQPLDRRSDLFAVGVILYELLVGWRPFDAASDMELMNNIINARYQPAREVDPEIPPELEKVLETALAHDRGDRYDSASDMQAALEAFLFSQRIPVGARELAAFVETMCPPSDEKRAEVTGETNPRPAPEGEANRSALVTRSMPTRAPRGPDTLVGETGPDGQRALEQTRASPMARTLKVPPVPTDAVPEPQPRGLRAWHVAVPVAAALVAVALAVGLRQGATPEPAPVPVAAVEPPPSPPPALPPHAEEPAKEHAEEPATEASVKPADAPKPAPAPERHAPPRREVAAKVAPPKPAPLKTYVNVRARVPIELFVDGKSAGTAAHYTLAAGRHQLRAECVSASGRTVGLEQALSLPPEQDLDLSVSCP